MIFKESRLTEEYQIKDNLYGFVRIYHTPETVRVDFSLYEKFVEREELHVYSQTIEGKCPTEALAVVYRILANENLCLRLWKEGKDFRKMEEEK